MHKQFASTSRHKSGDSCNERTGGPRAGLLGDDDSLVPEGVVTPLPDSLAKHIKAYALLFVLEVPVIMPDDFCSFISCATAPSVSDMA